jgi:hypothetical protein
MDFNRLSSGLDAGISKQLADQLLANTLFRDAALKANQTEEDPNKTQAPINSGLDNLLNQLSNTLNQAVNSANAPQSSVPTATGNYSPESIEALMHHPLMDTVLNEMSLEDALGIRVLLGQVDADAAQDIVGLLNSLPASTVGKVQSVLKNLSSEDIQKGITFFQALFAPNDDTVFAQSNNFDVYYNNSNIRTVFGADLDSFLNLAYHVDNKGQDFGKFLDASTEVLQKGDYDDFRRFLQVGGFVLLQGESLEKFYDFGSKILNQSPNDYEGNAFQVYMTLAHGGKLQEYIDIADNLETTGFEGRNNLVDLTRMIVDFRNQGAYTPYLFQSMAAVANSGGDVRDYMNKYMLERGMMSTKPDPRASKYARIERIDGEPMTIKQGESAALFAQAVSTRDGLLPESVLFWSSKEEGPMAQGSSYLDLSKLGVGVHHITVKIGNYAGGTDTAIKTVIVEAAEGHENDPSPEVVSAPQQVPANQGIVLPESGQIRITVQKGAAGLRSDLYLRQNGQEDLVTQRAQSNTGFSIDKQYNAGDRLDLFIKTFNGGTTYDHGTDTETYNGKSYAKVEQIGENKWRVSFEDLPGHMSDWDYNDVVVEVELVPSEAAQVTGSAPVETNVEPVSNEEAIQMTQAALSSLSNGGKALAEYASSMKERYYKSLDSLVGYNQDYMRQLRDYMDQQEQRQDELRAMFNQILTSLTGTGSSSSEPTPEVIAETPATPPAVPTPEATATDPSTQVDANPGGVRRRNNYG